MAKLTFLGAAGCVTGSKYLVEAAGKKLLVDCGLFQGTNELKDRNWKPLPVDPGAIDYAMLTHAHLRSEEHTSELQSRLHLVCRLLLEKKKKHCYCVVTNSLSSATHVRCER